MLGANVGVVGNGLGGRDGLFVEGEEEGKLDVGREVGEQEGDFNGMPDG